MREWRVDHLRCAHRPHAERVVALVDRAGLEQLTQRGEGLGGPRGDHEPRRVVVEPVDDAGLSRRVADAGHLRVAGDQRARERARLALAQGMTWHVGDLVHDDQRRVFVDHLEWRVGIGSRREIRRLGVALQRHHFARVHAVALSGPPTIHPHRAVRGQTLGLRPAHPRRACAQKEVQPDSIVLLGDLEFHAAA